MAQQPTHITFTIKPIPGHIGGQLQEGNPGRWTVESHAKVAHVAKMLEVHYGLQPRSDPSPASLAHRRTYPFTIYKWVKKGVFCPLSASKTLADVFKTEPQEADLGEKTLFFGYQRERYNK